MSGYRSLRSFAWLLGGASSGLLAVIAFSPAVTWWFHGVSGLSLELAGLAVLPIRIFAVIPALEVLLAFQRARFVVGKCTHPITKATAIEVAVIAAVLLLAVSGTGLVGVTAAALAAVGGRLLRHRLSSSGRAGKDRSRSAAFRPIGL